jgi:hypothetical protein
MTRLRPSLILIAILLYFSSELIAQTEQPSRVIVLCDVSNSITTVKDGNADRIGKMKQLCKAIIRHYPAGSEISFYIISSNAVEAPFLLFNVPTVPLNGKGRIHRIFKYQDSAIIAGINKATQRPGNQTCILTSVENAYETFAAGDENKPGMKNELIIFSDMFEQCRVSPIGNIVMNNKGEFLTTAQKKAIDHYEPKSRWKKNHVYIQIFDTTPRMEPALKNNVEVVWHTLFSKLWSEQAKKDQLYFLPNLQFSPRQEYR